MAERVAVERMIREAYDARKRGDLDGVMRHFTDNPVFSVSGSPATSPVPMVASGRAAIQEVLRRLLDGFEFQQMKIVKMLVDGDHAVIHWHVRVKAIGSGQVAETDILDLVRIEDDKIASMNQFADTALINSMLGA